MKPILEPGKNCWCLEPAKRVAFLVDGQAIFEAFEAAACQAKKSLLIVGWDFDSRVNLRRSASPDRDVESVTLGAFLENLVESREELEVHILIWDFSVIYAADREPLPIFNLDWKTHRRIHFALDSEHPIGACHHHKIVVIDDQLAMVGGFDLSNRRWDTPEHIPPDPRRIAPLGNSYPPFHDVQMLMQGPVAKKLGELARQRWYRATRRRLSVPVPVQKPAWPSSIMADFLEVPVAIARTEPTYKTRHEIREIEQLYVAVIAAAQHYVYIENQYLTSNVIVQALLARLEEETGPEIVIVLPKSNSGWLEENTMGRLRSGAVQALNGGDRKGRLGIYCPIIKSRGHPQQTELMVHSKLMIVDDRYALVGSANLNNRSMGLDMECDLALEIPETEPAQNGIAKLLNRLLAEHLGTTPSLVADTMAAQKSLLKTIEILNGNVHSLEVLKAELATDDEPKPPKIELCDPERPVQLDRMMDKMLIHEEAEGSNSQLRKINLAITVLVILTLIGLWRFSPLRQYLDVNRLVTWAESIRQHPLSWLYVLMAYLVGGLLFFPVTAQIVATSTLFTPIPAFLYSLGGSMASAVLTYALGSWLGRNAIRTLAGDRLNRVSKQIARKGVMAVVVLR